MLYMLCFSATQLITWNIEREREREMEQGRRSRVKLESILSVVSGKPTEPGKIHKLSLLDRAMRPHTIHIVFYYGSNPFLDGPMPSDLGNLRVTLSELLDEYPYVTGRLTQEPDGDWQIKFNDAGVRMLQATVDATIDEWLRSADAAEERDLTAWEEMPHDPTFWSPFRLQINKFKCGGLALGLSCTHMHTDLTSATMLFKAWSEVHRRQPPTHPPIFELPPPLTPTPPIPTPSPHPTAPTKLATATFKFSAAAVDKCLSQAPPGATPFDVLAALFWCRAAQWQPHASKRSLSICVDFRDQGQHPPVPYAYFGNALRFSTLTVDADDLLSGGLGQVAGHVHRHVAGMRKEEFSSVVDENGSGGMYGGAALTCVNAEHMVEAESGRGIMYDAEFKKGERPVHVSYCVGNVAGEGLIMVMPAEEGGRGRTVTATLPEEQVAELCKDQVILDLGPNMILCGRR
ncbi:hydroxycinnamoyltransferase-like [Salvia miltiorrhiza]|uniref:hydroxycinnamoyltransferase-like n=1 Tax=Salvia miltiorrhiza TaxID=226208 RepID=UPI0025AD0491|nr:hydroxycinnamoyltransferase-like [Salvia miltiorrhiza]